MMEEEGKKEQSEEEEKEKEKEEEYNLNDESSRSNIKEDFISKLPDDVLMKILSIHPLDSAARTVALLTGLWNRPHMIKHGGGTVNHQDFESVVSELLLSFDEKDPLRNPRKLEFHFNQGHVLSATLGLNKKLHLDFSKGKHDFPRQFGWHLVLNTMDFPHPSPCPFFVKTLKLTAVNHLTSELVSTLISKFRYVESLTIEKCHGLRSLRVDALAKLVKLDVRDCPDLKSVFIEALELQCLRLQGRLCWFSLESVKYLEDVMLAFREGPGYNHLNHLLYDSLLQAIRDVKVLTLHGWVFKEVFRPWLSSEQHEQHFRFSKLEHLWWIDSAMEDHNIVTLFSFLKYCTSLKRLFINIDPKSYSMPRISTGDQTSSEAQKGGRLRKLKVVKLEGFENEEDMIFLKEKLMEVFNAEPRVITVKPGSLSRCLIRIPKPQRSGTLRVGATESQQWKFCYKFVEEVEDNIGLCSKHPHMA